MEISSSQKKDCGKVEVSKEHGQPFMDSSACAGAAIGLKIFVLWLVSFILSISW